MSSLSFTGSTARMFSSVRPGGGSSVCKRRMARALVVSLVWEESIRAMRVWKRLSLGFFVSGGIDLVGKWGSVTRGLRCSSARVSQPIVSTGASLDFRISFTAE